MAQRPEIIDVWRDNLDAEMASVRELVEHYPYIGMDTEFPGVVARPIGGFRPGTDYVYQTLRCNVDLLKLIQLGLTFCDENGRRPEGTCTWQFNFRFSLNDDMYSPESISLLQESGLNFKQHEDHGIDPEYFGELLISSGLLLFDDVKWVTFHSCYDFGYMLKMVSLVDMPTAEPEFFELLKIWFPCVYDIKTLMRSCKNLRGGLNEVAKDLGIPRHGTEHQAGSDSLLTADVFFAIRTQYFDDILDDGKYMNQLFSLTSGAGSPLPSYHQSHPSDDPHALTPETGSSGSAILQPPGSVGRRRHPPVPHHTLSGYGSGQDAIPRQSSAISIKNPNAALRDPDGGSVSSGTGRAGSPAVR